MATDPQNSDLLWQIIDGLAVVTAGIASLFVRTTLKRVEKTETDLKEHKKVVYSKLEKQDTLLAAAVEKLADTHTVRILCRANHKAIDDKFNSMVTLNDEQHSHTREVLNSVVDELKDIKRRLEP